jgi:type II secretory pathway component PulF
MNHSVEEPAESSGTNGGPSAKRLTDSEAAALAEQVSGLTAAGLPLSGGLRAMAEEIPLSGFHRALLDLAARLERGAALETALEQLGPALPEHVRGLVRAGVRSGRLGEILAQYVRYRSMAVQLRRKAESSMAYPSVLFLVFVSIFWFMLVVIVPKFKKIFMDFGVELPQITLSLLYVSDWFYDYWLGTLIILGGGLVVAWLLTKLFMPPTARRRLFYLTPLVGPLSRWTGLAQFSRLLAMLVECELPLPTALQLAGGGVADAEVADAARQLAREIESGRPLAECQTRYARFPAALAQGLQMGEDSQALAESLRAAAEMMEGQAMIHSEFVFRAAPPLTMFFIVAALGYIVVGLFMPLIKLITELSG